MGIINHFTRGGQLALHKYQMIKQVAGITVLLCVLSGVGIFSFLMVKHTKPYDRYLYFQYLQADLLVSTTFNDESTSTQKFKYHNGDIREVRSIDILNNKFIRRKVSEIEKTALSQGCSSLWGALGVLMLLIFFFAYRGHIKARKKLERGNSILDKKKLTKLIKKQKKASDLNLDGLPFIKDKETSHILITGTTGAGKSNCLNTLLPQIRARGDRAIVVDLTGDFVKRLLSGL